MKKIIESKPSTKGFFKDKNDDLEQGRGPNAMEELLVTKVDLLQRNQIICSKTTVIGTVCNFSNL